MTWWLSKLVFVFGSKRKNGYGLTPAQIREGLLPLLMLSHLQIPSKCFYPCIFGLYIRHDIDLINAVHVALIKGTPAADFYSHDRDFDQVGTGVRLDF